MSERDQVRFGATVIDYILGRSRRRRKTIEIALNPGRGVRVATPLTTPHRRTEQTVAKKRAGRIVTRASKGMLNPQRKQFVSGESLPYLGRQVRLLVEYRDTMRVGVDFNYWSLQIAAPASLSDESRQAAITRAITRWYRRQADERLRECVERWSVSVGCPAPPIWIRNQRQRWGSCGPNGVLHFNWRIIMAPPALIDYVVIHELVHLSVSTHSAAFWSRISALMPDYKLRRARLKDLGPSLSL